MNQPGPGQPLAVQTITVDDLKRWEDHGATWRTVELSDEQAVLELCTCYGEPVEMVKAEAPELIAFVRDHPPET